MGQETAFTLPLLFDFPLIFAENIIPSFYCVLWYRNPPFSFHIVFAGDTLCEAPSLGARSPRLSASPELGEVSSQAVVGRMPVLPGYLYPSQDLYQSSWISPNTSLTEQKWLLQEPEYTSRK